VALSPNFAMFAFQRPQAQIQPQRLPVYIPTRFLTHRRGTFSLERLNQLRSSPSLLVSSHLLLLPFLASLGIVARLLLPSQAISNILFLLFRCPLDLPQLPPGSQQKNGFNLPSSLSSCSSSSSSSIFSLPQLLFIPEHDHHQLSSGEILPLSIIFEASTSKSCFRELEGDSALEQAMDTSRGRRSYFQEVGSEFDVFPTPHRLSISPSSLDMPREGRNPSY